jgi:spore coat polysaccharide biosynthesis predicted glycosyltransferase SpsG
VRALRLAAAMGARVWLSADGPTPRWTPSRVTVAGVRGVTLLDAVRPHLVVLDTPVASDGQRWVAAARRRRIAIASIHDRGIAPQTTDLAIDGSLAATGAVRGARRSLVGPKFMVVDPAVGRTRRVPSRGRVVIALGGGSRVNLARRIGRELLRRCPGVHVVVAAGFGAGGGVADGLTWIGPRRSLAPVLAAAEVAIVAGGITLYEAAALGVPSVAVAIVPAQRATVHAFARADAALAVTSQDRADAIAAKAVLLLRDRVNAGALAGRARRLVDGNGTARVASVLRRLAEEAA